jgi:hypothetical protein
MSKTSRASLDVMTDVVENLIALQLRGFLAAPSPSESKSPADARTRDPNPSLHGVTPPLALSQISISQTDHPRIASHLLVKCP